MHRISGARLVFSECRRLSKLMASYLGEPRVYYESPDYVRFSSSKLDLDGKMNLSSPTKDDRKKILDSSDCAQMVRLCSELHLQCRTYLAIIRASSPSDNDFSENAQSDTDVVYTLKKLHTLLESGFSARIKYLYSIASDYDFGSLRANGIRSFLIITMRCCAVLLTYLRQMSSYSISNWSGITHRSVISYVNCLIELNVCLEVVSHSPRFANPLCLFPRSEFVDLPEIGHCDTKRIIRNPLSVIQTANSKFDSKQYLEDLSEFYRLETLSDNIKQEYFYGRCLAFYLCPSAQRILQFLNSLMAGYGNSFLTSKQGIASLVNTVYRSVTSYLSPEDRGKMLAKLTRNSSVQFCKMFWSLAELRVISEGPNVILPSMAVAHSFKIQTIPLKMFSNNQSEESDKEFVEIETPKSHIGITPLQMRVLSRHLRPGLEWTRGNELPNFFFSQSSSEHKIPENCYQRSNSVQLPTFGLFSPRNSLNTSSLGSKTPTPNYRRRFTYANLRGLNPTGNEDSSSSSPSVKRSPYLLFYIHGGGFIALNSQSQDNFLRIWAEQLDCPILAVDYSLAPEAPYPRALEDCYYAYCWVALNREHLGCTPDARIVLGGDSAGGNLALGVCMRALHDGILDSPVGLFLAYTPVLVSLTPSPSRLLSLCDPLLPIGVLSKCLLAYAGVDEATLNLEDASSSSSAASDAKIVDNSTNLESKENSPNSPLWSRLASRLWYGTSKGEEEEEDEGINTNKSSHLHRSSNAAKAHFRNHRDHSMPSNLSLLLNQRSHSITPLTNPNTYRKPSKLNESESHNYNSNPSSCCSTAPGNYYLPQESLRYSNDNSTEERNSAGNHLPCRPPTDLNRVRNIPLSQDAYMSPYLASDDMLRKLPPMAIVCSQFDPFLDDALELAKRVSKLDILVDVRVLEDLPHAFLNFCLLGPEFQNANKICIQILNNLLNECYKPETLSSPAPAPSPASASPPPQSSSPSSSSLSPTFSPSSQDVD
ncbi:unnamed protein product [Trichobilharzia szidati]|nr:unnamed protein product [Trichobilharzia szidati]